MAEDTDIVEAVRYLTENERFPFPAVHWQMDANFWNDYGMRDYAAWVSESYNPGIRSLVAFWVETMRTPVPICMPDGSCVFSEDWAPGWRRIW